MVVASGACAGPAVDRHYVSRHMATRSVPDLGIEYDLWGENPVQALGEIRGREFDFRAKHYGEAKRERLKGRVSFGS